jgi:hypothetical protein
MVLSIDQESKKLIATVQNEGKTEQYECIISACENPVCTCGSVYLELIPVQSQNDHLHPIPARKVSIDIERRILERKGKGKTPIDDMDFARLILSELDEYDFTLLYSRMFQFKNTITESSSIDSFDACFDYDKVECDGLMSAYNEVLPYADQLCIIFDDKRYLLFDNYCLLPKCSCTNATLSIISVDSNGKPSEELCSVSLNYRKRQWKQVEKFLISFPLETLKSAIEAQIPDIYDRLLARHIKIKAIYAHCKKRHFRLKTSIELPRVGRNAPCPCGSGKKFKKCCMGKAG